MAPPPVQAPRGAIPPNLGLVTWMGACLPKMAFNSSIVSPFIMEVLLGAGGTTGGVAGPGGGAFFGAGLGGGAGDGDGLGAMIGTGEENGSMVPVRTDE